MGEKWGFFLLFDAIIAHRCATMRYDSASPKTGAWPSLISTNPESFSVVSSFPVTIVSSLYNPSYAWLGCFCAWNLIESPVACFCSKLLRFPSNKKNYQYKKIINTKKIISTKKIINKKKFISTKKISSKLNRNPIFTNIYQYLLIFPNIYLWPSPCGRRKIYQQMEIIMQWLEGNDVGQQTIGSLIKVKRRLHCW